METLRLTIALFLPWLLGVVWLRCRWNPASEGALAMVLGYGYLIGILVTILTMLAIDAVGLSQDFLTILTILTVLTVVGYWFSRDIPWRNWGGGLITLGWRGQPTWQKVICGFLLALIAVRLTGVALEIVWRPLYPWDAWMNWAPKTKVWFEHKELVPFVDPNTWLNDQTREFYTIDAWRYPPAIPLIQLWMALAIGRWEESFINLPWLFCGMALGLAFYGQARIWGIPALAALIFTYFLLSMPFTGTHIALAGYAELWLSTTYLLAVMAFFHWLRTGDRRQGVLALLLASSLVLIKVPGIVWALTFIPALLVALLPRRILVGSAIAVSIMAMTWFLSGGFEVKISGLGRFVFTTETIAIPYIGSYSIQYHPGVWEALAQNLFILDNWHLLGYLTVIAFLVALPLIFRDRVLLAMATLIVAGLAFLGIVFFFTHRAAWIIDYTTTNRAIFHMMPVLAYFVLITFYWRFSKCPVRHFQ